MAWCALGIPVFFTHERIAGECRLQFLANMAFCLAVRLADQILTSFVLNSQSLDSSEVFEGQGPGGPGYRLRRVEPVTTCCLHALVGHRRSLRTSVWWRGG